MIIRPVSELKKFICLVHYVIYLIYGKYSEIKE